VSLDARPHDNVAYLGLAEHKTCYKTQSWAQNLNEDMEGRTKFVYSFRFEAVI
jgi:hypothetical protein